MVTAASKKWLKELRQMATHAPTPESKAHYEKLIAKELAYQQKGSK